MPEQVMVPEVVAMDGEVKPRELVDKALAEETAEGDVEVAVVI